MPKAHQCSAFFCDLAASTDYTGCDSSSLAATARAAMPALVTATVGNSSSSKLESGKLAGHNQLAVETAY